MKLNIGCGSVYKKGYVNIDAQEGTLADRIMSAHRLEMDDSTVELIECHHVLEHLSAAEAIYAISEFYRVLATGGVLTLLTPDIETSFKRFSKSSEEERKYLMNWIYGIDRPGMEHKYGYPIDLLKIMLNDAGFGDVIIRRLHSKSVQPELYASCMKRKSRPVNEFMAQVLRKLTGRNMANLANQVKALEGYSVLKAILPDLGGVLDRSKTKGLSRIAVKLAVHSPSISLVFLETADEMRVGQEREVLRLIDRVKNLKTIGMPRILVQMMKEHPVLGTNQHFVFDSVLRLGMKSISKVISEVTRKQTLQALEQSAAKTDVPLHVDLFTEGMLRTMSQDSNAHASKEFALENLDWASKLYMEALALDRSNLVARRNLSRVLYLLGDVTDSLRHLDEVESLSAVFSRTYQKQVMEALGKERKAMTSGQNELISTPVYSILA